MFEINLVPDLKAEILKTQRIRNIVFIVCVLTMIAIGVFVISLFSVKVVQDVQINDQTERLKKMSSIITNYEDLNEFLTIQNQLNNIDKIAETRVDYSRIFNLINTLAPTNGDIITFSDVSADLVNNTLRFDAEADAVNEPLIDYRVLEAFKKSMEYMKFDYGEYKNENNITIPSVCIIETDENGDILKDEETNDLYAIWTKGVSGCDPEDQGTEVEDEDGNKTIERTEVVNILEENVLAARDSEESVKIWRTPQFKKWYGNRDEKKNYMNSYGEINGIEHFESKCIKYEVVDNRWSSSNECNLIVGDLNISESSNGKSSTGLVLKFKASLVYNREALLVKNKHMSFIAPSGFVNVTDSSLQIQKLFREEAVECEKGDVDCADTGDGGDYEI